MFTKGNLTFRTIRTSPLEAPQVLLKLRDLAFIPDQPVHKHGHTSSGLTGIRHIADLEFLPQDLIVGDYLALGLRRDSHKAPAAIKLAVEQKLKAQRKWEKKDLKDATDFELDKLAETGQFQRVQHAQFLWNVRAGLIHLSTDSEAVYDDLQALLRVGFDLKLQPAAILDYGEQIQARQLVTDESADLPYPLGHECLMLAALGVYFVGPTKLAAVQGGALDGQQMKATMQSKGNQPLMSGTAIQAVLAGHWWTSLDVFLSDAADAWELTLKADSLTVSNLKVTEVDVKNERQALEFRADLTGKVWKALDAHYAQLATVRKSEVWGSLWAEARAQVNAVQGE